MICLKRFFKICLLFSVFFLNINLGFCQKAAIESKYFTLEFYKDCDLIKLIQKLNVNYFLHADVFSSEPEDIDSIISKTFDALYLEVCDILDIHIYSYHGKIKVYPNKKELEQDVLRGYIEEKFGLPSVYEHSKNTIHISYPDITLGMLAHEVAHAIISHYFIVPPSPKVQEVLTGYVEYSIRKTTGTLSDIKK